MTVGDRSAERILVADDDADAREYLTRLLRNRWFVEAVPDGQAALEAAKKGAFDLIVADVRMPRIDGFGLLRSLRENASLRAIPVIMISARASPDVRIAGLEAGADDYLIKPFSSRELIARVTSCLGLRRAVRDAYSTVTCAPLQEDDLDRGARSSNEALGVIAHELKNPLAPIQAALDLMRDRGMSSLEQDVIERQVAHLTRLVDHLVDASRLAREKLVVNRRRVEIAEVVTRALEMFTPEIKHRSLRLQVDVPQNGHVVDADVERMAQVLAALLSNAAKFSDSGSRIVVAAKVVDGKVRIRVRDYGIGMTADVLAKVFDPFVRAASAVDRARGGLGLGLTIAKGIVEMHGGTIAVRSAGAWLGSEVIVTLPWIPGDAALLS
jgi:signal transduction histidine kinase